MKRKYRIVHNQKEFDRAFHMMYKVEVWDWYWPFWVSTQKFQSIEDAKAAIKRMENPVVEVVT